MNKRGLFFCGFTLASAYFFAGCEFYHEKQRPSFTYKTSDLSFSLVKTQVFQPRCLSCHNANNPSGGVALDTYGNVRQFIDKVDETVFVSQTMPKTGALNLIQKRVLRAWIDAGIPENSSSQQPTPTPEPVESRFSSIRDKIFVNKCISCHDTGGKAAKVPLIDYQALLGSPRDLVLPGNADESGLVISVERNDDKRMPPPESAQPKLSDYEKSTIREWIKNGAKND